MKTIKIAHLYYDLMNLYGENGNTRVLAKAFERQGLNCEVHFLSIDDEIDFDKYDLYYIGTGSEENLLLVNNNLKKYKREIKTSINSNKFFIATGNALELFGERINKLNGKNIKTLGVFPYECNETDFRIIGEQFYTTKLIDKLIIGFQNRQTVMSEVNSNLFNVIKGTGYKPKSKLEGIHVNNFFGTYLLGPILVRNPYLLDYIVKEVLESKHIKYKKQEENIMYYAYQEYIENFYTH